MAVRMAELHCVKHGIWWCSIFYVGVGCPFIIRVENNLSQMRSSSMQSMERIVPLSVSTQSQPEPPTFETARLTCQILNQMILYLHYNYQHLVIKLSTKPFPHKYAERLEPGTFRLQTLGSTAAPGSPFHIVYDKRKNRVLLIIDQGFYKQSSATISK